MEPLRGLEMGFGGVRRSAVERRAGAFAVAQLCPRLGEPEVRVRVGLELRRLDEERGRLFERGGARRVIRRLLEPARGEVAAARDREMVRDSAAFVSAWPSRS